MNSELSILLFLTVYRSFPICCRVITLCICDIFLILHHWLSNDFKIYWSFVDHPHNREPSRFEKMRRIFNTLIAARTAITILESSHDLIHQWKYTRRQWYCDKNPSNCLCCQLFSKWNNVRERNSGSDCPLKVHELDTSKDCWMLKFSSTTGLHFISAEIWSKYK